MPWILYTLFHILHIYIRIDIISKRTFHIADMEDVFLAPLKVVAMGVTFLYVLDTFFQKDAILLLCMEIAMTSAQAISSL